MPPPMLPTACDRAPFFLRVGGEVRTTRTTAFGYYRFDEVAAGQTYVLEARSKQFRYAPQVIYVADDLIDLNFAAR